LLDAARMQTQMVAAKALNANNVSLYKGRSEETLVDVAPFLFTFNNQNSFGQWYYENGWGNAWGLLLKTEIAFEDVQRHFRKFLLVKTEDDIELYFRFYDPRVLRIFLPTCNSNQLKEFFGPISYFICEDEDSEFGIKFWLENYELCSTRQNKKDLFASYSKPSEKVVVEKNIEVKTETKSEVDTLNIPRTQIQNPSPSPNTEPKPNKPRFNLLD